MSDTTDIINANHFDGQWDEEKVQRLKIALTASRMYCEEDGEEDEGSEDQSKLSCNAS